jgi:hypothetical protein
MAEKLLRLIRGAGSILEVAPDPARETIRPLYTPDLSTSEALGRTWSRVGDYLRSSMDTAEGDRTHQERASA